MSSGRPLNFQPDQALERAIATFWREGYDGASLQKLLGATRLSKSSLYDQFGSKDALFRLCLELYGRQMASRLEQLRQQSASGRAFIEWLLGQIIRESQPAQGCLIFNTASEFGQSDAAIAACVQQALDGFRAVFLRALQQDQTTGRLPADTELDALADYLMTIIGGLRSMVKAGVPLSQLQSTITLALQVLGPSPPEHPASRPSSTGPS